MRVADLVAGTLKAYGTEFFFQVTGGDPVLWNALQSAGIKMVSCRSEKGAVYMADGYARASCRPGYVYGQHGPGLSNVAAGLADPFWAMSPVVSLASSMPLGSRGRYEYQELDQLAHMSAVTRWRGAVVRADQTARLLRQAIRVATGSPPGPVHYEVPRDLLPLECKPEALYADNGFGTVPSQRPAPDPDLLPDLVSKLLTAERPLILAGAGALISQAWDELTGLAERLRIPVATSLGGKGVFAEDHELSVGVVGRYATLSSNAVVRECDVVLAVGTRLGGLVTDAWRLLPPSVRIIQIDLDSSVLATNYPVVATLQADARSALRAILAETDEHQPALARWERWSADVARRLRDGRQSRQASDAGGENAIHPAFVITTVRSVLSPGDALVADTGYMAAWTAAYYPITVPGRNYFRAAGSLGWAFPASIGVKLARPGARVVCVTGDGGIGYHVSELETAVRVGVPVVVVVMNNRGLAFEYHSEKFHGGNVIDAINDFGDVDYSAVARDFGAYGARVASPEELAPALQAALDSGRPALLEVMTDREQLAPVTSFDAEINRPY